MDKTRVAIAGLLCAILVAGSEAQERVRAREIGRTTERELNVILSSSFGSVFISRGEPEKILVIETESRDGAAPVSVDYAIRNRVGYADVSLGSNREEGEKEKKKGSFHLSDLDKGRWFLRLSDAVAVSLEIELGVGSGDFNLSGLKVKDFRLSSGASNVTLAFDEPNSTQIENLTIESGFSKFDGRNLCNARFRTLNFEGGVGSYTLDFGGTLDGEVDVSIDVGLGVVTLLIPSEVGARVSYDKSWISQIDCDEDFKGSGENEYISDNYQSAHGKMNIHIESDLGSVKLRRR